MKSVNIILLAAGGSTRMGGADKLTGKISGEALLLRSAKACTDSAAEETVIVLRPQDTDRANLVKELKLAIVENPDWEQGMGSSLRIGMSQIDDGCDGVLIMLADMPDISAKEIDLLISEFGKLPTRGIIRASTNDGKPGQPVLFSRDYFSDLSSVSGDVGARGVVKANLKDVTLIPLPGNAALTDLDTMDDWDQYTTHKNSRD